METNGVTTVKQEPEVKTEETPTEDFQKLTEYGINIKVANEIVKIYETGKLSPEDLDERAMDALKEYNPDDAIAVLKQFCESSLEHVGNKSAFLCGMMKTYRQNKKQGAQASPARGPDPNKLSEILERTGYSLDVTTGQRKYGGPPPGEDDQNPPPPGCEVFCGKIPKDVFEDELIPLFEKCGKIWDLRLMMDPLTQFNRGYCFITFCTKEGAEEATKLDNYAIKPGKNIKVNISVANQRLFVGNIPKSKSKDEIMEEFSKKTEGLVDVIIYRSAEKENQKNRGFAFLEYDSHKSASTAKRKLSTGRLKVWNCDVIVDWADPVDNPDDETMSKVKVLYVRNLTSEVTEDIMKEKFGEFGKIERAKKVKDYGFIHFEDRDDAIKAMQAMNGQKIGKLEIEVSLAKPPSENKKKEQRKREQERQSMMMAMRRGGGPYGGYDDFYAPPMMGPPRGMPRGGGGGGGGGGMRPRMPPPPNNFYDDYYDYDYDYYQGGYGGPPPMMRGRRGGGGPPPPMRGRGGGPPPPRGGPRGAGGVARGSRGAIRGARGAPRGRGSAAPPTNGNKSPAMRGGGGAGKRKAGGDMNQGQMKRRNMNDNWGAQPIAQQPLDQAGFGGGGYDSQCVDNVNAQREEDRKSVISKEPESASASPTKQFGKLAGLLVKSKLAASIAASAGGADSKRPRALIWPEWNEKDVNDEKWDVVQKAKKEDKGKSPVAQQHYFDDPEGKIELPSSLKVETWKRPNEFITEKTPVVVDPDGMASFDLISSNEHIHHSELMRYIISQIVALWENTTEKNVPPDQAEPNQPYEEMIHSWRPWEHIYALMKVQKPPFVTPYNAYGKYVVKLYWMGCWRKLIVDDAMPFDENDKLLLPATSMQHELWPMLLTKALIKVASLDYTGGSQSSEFGDCSIVQCLTGWIPEAIPLQSLMSAPTDKHPGPTSGSGRASPLVTASQVLDKYIQLSSQPKSAETAAMPHGKAHKVKSGVKQEHRHGHVNEVWELLKASLPEWKLPLQEWEKQLMAEQQEQEKKEADSATPHEMTKDNLSEKDGAKGDKAEKTDPKAKDGKDKGKDAKDKGGKDKDKKGGDKDKAKGAEKEKTMDELPVPENPEVVVFATYWSTPKYPVKVSVLGEMADASEKLRQNGLSHIYPHPVCISQTRSCPLEPPPPPEKIPAWKLIRPKKKKPAPSDEPVSTPEPPKPIQCLEIKSPFLNYKVSPFPIPTDTTRPRSSLSRGGTRSRPATGNINQIEETDENAPEPEIKKPEPEKEEPQKVEEPPQIIEPEVKPSTPSKEKRKSASKTKEPQREGSPKGKRASSAKGDKPKSAARPDSKGKEKEEKAPKASPPAAAPAPPPSDAGGFAPPPPTDPEAVPLEGEEGVEQPEPQEEHVIDEEAAKAKKVWMDFEIFCKCFKTLYIYHKPHTYKYNHKHSDLKSVTQAAAPVGKGDKKGAQGNVGGGGTLADERAPHYLFVDNLKPTEIVVSFSALSRWHDPPPQGIEEAKSHTNLKGKKGDPEKELTTITSSSVMEGSIAGEPKPPAVVNPGTLVAEPYSWKSLVTGQPILRIRTTATKAAVLNLPAGRHVLRFMMSGPLGYCVHLVSTVPFVFGNEEEVMPELTKESCRFVDNALQVINSIGKCINSFTDTEAFKRSWDELVSHHCPYRHDKLMSKQHHFEVFNDALYNMLRKSLSDIATPDIAFAWRCFTFDSTTKNILGLPTSSRPGTATTSHRGSAKPPGGGKEKDKDKDKGKQQQQQRETEKVENPWANREPTPFEHTSAVKIQKNWKAFYVRKITQARTQGTEENVKVAENLQKCWNVIEPNAEQNGLFLFRYMFKTDPDIMVKYPFYQDEWNKISYADYSGTYTDQPPNNWFLVFREIFYVTEEMLAVPKLYVPINTCLLRVVNNDTGEEIPRVFQKVAPYVYKKNRKGYTFVAEARTTDQGIPSNKWRMRLIGSLSPLPAPAKPDTVNSSFVVKHITDYYMPNSSHVIFRYTVKVTEDHLSTIQVNTSKLDVYIKLVILDNEVEVATTQGKGHAVIPSFLFLKDFDPNEEKRPSSRASTKETKGKGGSKENVGKKRSGSGKSPEGRLSRPSSRHSDASEIELEERDFKPHKYIIQAMVLKNSWPLSESSWAFVQMLKDLEKNELKVVNKERPPSPPKQEKTAASTGSKDKGKGGAKGKDKGKDKDQKGSRPSSQQFDHSKPHWSLRIASDASSADDIEVKKDTERADEIRALKRAWENAEEGRAVKAMQSRLKYLNSHTLKSDDKEETEAGEEKPVEQEEVPPPQTPLSLHGEQGEENLTLEPPPAPTPTEMLQPMDFSPFLKKPEREPRYLDDEEIRRREEEQKKQVEEYKAFRDQVKAWREQDKQKRNLTKIRQLEQCEELQAMLDAARESINAPREAIRQKYLEAERKKQEELEAKEAASLSDQNSKSPKGRKSAKGKKSPANGKKKGK